MKLLLACAVFAACLIGGTQTAMADPPPPECQGNPHFCHGGDTITVSDEPPGENCPNGGIKVEVIHPVPPDVDPLTEIPEPPEPEVEVFYICNGLDGEPGEPGEDGEPGTPGAPGTPGTQIIGPFGIPGINITQDTAVNVNISGGAFGNCQSLRRRARLVLPERLRSFSTVRVRIDRGRARQALVRNNRSVRVNMRGKRCGPHVITVRKRNVPATVRLWTVTSAIGISKRVLVP